jgi:hypothetical protein
MVPVGGVYLIIANELPKGSTLSERFVGEFIFVFAVRFAEFAELPSSL